MMFNNTVEFPREKTWIEALKSEWNQIGFTDPRDRMSAFGLHYKLECVRGRVLSPDENTLTGRRLLNRGVDPSAESICAIRLPRGRGFIPGYCIDGHVVVERDSSIAATPEAAFLTAEKLYEPLIQMEESWQKLQWE